MTTSLSVQQGRKTITGCKQATNLAILTETSGTQHGGQKPSVGHEIHFRGHKMVTVFI